MISHNALSASAWAATATSHDPRHDPALLPLPLSHVYGLMVSVMSLHRSDPGTTVLMRWFDPAGWLALAQQHKVSISPLVPSMLQMLLQQPLEDYDLSALVRLTSGAAPLPRPGDRRLPAAAAGRRDRRGVRLHGDGRHHRHLPGRCRPARQRRPAGARRGGPDRAAGRHRGGARRGRRDLRPRAGGHVRLLERPGGDRGRRCAAAGCTPATSAGSTRRLPVHRGPDQGPDHPGRLQRLPARCRGRAGPAPRRGRRRRGRAAPTRSTARKWWRSSSFVPARRRSAGRAGRFAKEHLSAVKYPREVRVIDAIPLTSVMKTDRKQPPGASWPPTRPASHQASRRWASRGPGGSTRRPGLLPPEPCLPGAGLAGAGVFLLGRDRLHASGPDHHGVGHVVTDPLAVPRAHHGEKPTIADQPRNSTSRIDRRNSCIRLAGPPSG